MRRVIILFVTAFLLLAACKPKPAKPGEKCRAAGIGSCADSTHLIKCVSGTWLLASCLGPGGCAAASNNRFTCDASIANAGDGCLVPKTSACAADGKQMLECNANKLLFGADCQGPAGCTVDATTKRIHCDQSISALGATCSDEGKSACVAEKNAALKCTAGKFVLDSACGGPKACIVDGTIVRCDASVGDVGDACPGAGMACSKDAKAALDCKGGRLSLAKKCKKGCEVKGGDVYCN